MSFKFTNVLIIYQSAINDVLRKCLNIIVIIYFDNTLIFFKTLKNYKEYVKIVLKCLNEQNFFSNQRNVNFINKK